MASTENPLKTSKYDPDIETTKKTSKKRRKQKTDVEKFVDSAKLGQIFRLSLLFTFQMLQIWYLINIGQGSREEVGFDAMQVDNIQGPDYKTFEPNPDRSEDPSSSCSSVWKDFELSTIIASCLLLIH